jgi:DNA-directed RNA polymerase specialized sigma24 family protein
MRERAFPSYRRSTLTQSAFDRLLAALDADREQAGEKYERIRHKLVTFFECRAAPSPDDEADETISRVARRLEEGEQIEHLAAYFYGVARLVLLEYDRQQRREATAWAAVAEDRPDLTGEDARLPCLEGCLASLPAASRELLVSYYAADQTARIRQRQELAQRHGIPMNALRIRVHRLRVTLEACVSRCLGESSMK